MGCAALTRCTSIRKTYKEKTKDGRIRENHTIELYHLQKIKLLQSAAVIKSSRRFCAEKKLG